MDFQGRRTGEYGSGVVTTDGVEPSGNAVMAEVLTVLGHYLEHPGYLTRADAMISNLQKRFSAYPSSYAAWAKQALTRIQGITTLVITGPEALANASLLNQQYNYAVLIAAAESSSELPIFTNRFIPDQNLIFSCHNSTCAPPVSSIDDLLL